MKNSKTKTMVYDIVEDMITYLRGRMDSMTDDQLKDVVGFCNHMSYSDWYLAYDAKDVIKNMAETNLRIRNKDYGTK